MQQKEKITLIAVDDHNQIRGEICKMLESEGLDVVLQAENGAVALERLAGCTTLPDVCLLDCNMPVMNGVETAKAMSARYPTIKILGYSIDKDLWTITGMLKAGASGFVSKGSSLEILTEAVTGIHKKGYYFDEAACKAVLDFIRAKA